MFSTGLGAGAAEKLTFIMKPHNGAQKRWRNLVERKRMCAHK